MTIGVGSLVTKLAYRPCKLIFRPSLCPWMLYSVLLGEFAKLRKATISFVMPGVRPFVHLSNSMEHLGSQCSGAHDIWYSRISPPPSKNLSSVYMKTYVWALLFLLDRYVPTRRSRELLLYFLKVIITAIFCLAAVVDCQTDGIRRQRWRSVGLSDGPVLIDQTGRKKKQPIHLKHVDEFLLE
jgi:hypothetical protein